MGRQEAPQEPGAGPQWAGGAPLMDLEHKDRSAQRTILNGFVHDQFVGEY